MRTNIVKKARKAQGPCSRLGCSTEIQVGDAYYWVSGRFSPKRVFCAHHPPRPSETTGSDKLSRLYAAQEQAEDVFPGAANPGAANLEDVSQPLRDAATEAEGVAQEYSGSADNIEEYFAQSPMAEDIRDKAESCETWGQHLNDVADEIEALDLEDYNSSEDDRMEAAVELATDALGELEL